MNRDQIKSTVTDHLNQALAGLESEHPKFDFKFKWYNLKEKKDENEFLKDTTAMANTVGLDGFIVIGFDDKSMKFNDSTFSDSELKDSNEINSLIVKRSSEAFDLNTYDFEIDNHKLSVIHIPPCLHKPILIKNFQTFDKNGNIKKEEKQRTFVRKNTSTFPASKYDIDLMYYDRKNIIPDYELFIDIISFSSRDYKDGTTQLEIGFTIENIGRRALSISKLVVDVDKGYMFDLISIANDKGARSHFHNQIIGANGLKYFKGFFLTSMNIQKHKSTNWRYMETEFVFKIKLSNGKEIVQKANYHR